MINEALNMLNSLTNESIADKKEMAIKKINEMVYKPETVIDNIIDLHELKNYNK